VSKINLSIKKRAAAAKAAAMGPPTAEQLAELLRQDLLAAANRYGQGTRTPTHGAREARLHAELVTELLHAAKSWVAAVAAHAHAHAADYAADYAKQNHESLESLSTMQRALRGGDR
jgi:hypothetical protein